MPRFDTLLVATSNPGKIREIRTVLADLSITLVGLDAFGDLPDAVEDADTFAANAEIKAKHYAALTNRIALADDSGLEVDALHGAPGVRSARFAGPQRNDLDNNAKLVEMLRTVPQPDRTARFRCAMVLADAHRVIARAEGTLDGQIIDEPRGHNGFGYDPHFLLPEIGQTTAQIDPDHKNKISHRGQAVRRIAEQIRQLIHANLP